MTARHPQPITIRPYTVADALELTRVFRSSVRSIASLDYTVSQIQVWAPEDIDVEQFGRRCDTESTWVAEIQGRIAGFSDLEPEGHIDMLYVHPVFARRGVARALLEHIEQAARANGLSRLCAEASMTARPVFEAMGFRTLAPQAVMLRGESFTNFRLEKRLEPPAPGPRFT